MIRHQNVEDMLKKIWKHYFFDFWPVNHFLQICLPTWGTFFYRSNHYLLVFKKWLLYLVILIFWTFSNITWGFIKPYVSKNINKNEKKPHKCRRLFSLALDHRNLCCNSFYLIFWCRWIFFDYYYGWRPRLSLLYFQ